MSDKNENISPIIEMHNVGIRYGQGPEILSDIKLCLKKGSFHFLTGKSGAGKTSLLSMMYLAQKPSRGVMGVFGKNINFANPGQFVAAAPQNRRRFSGFQAVGAYDRL